MYKLLTRKLINPVTISVKRTFSSIQCIHEIDRTNVKCHPILDLGNHVNDYTKYTTIVHCTLAKTSTQPIVLSAVI